MVQWIANSVSTLFCFQLIKSVSPCKHRLFLAPYFLDNNFNVNRSLTD